MSRCCKMTGRLLTLCLLTACCTTVFFADAQQSASKTKEVVIHDPILSRAVVRSLEIIGEASNKLNPDFKSDHPEIEWRKIISTRHKLIHDYFGVDYDIVWDIVSNKLLELLDFMEQIINAGQ